MSKHISYVWVCQFRARGGFDTFLTLTLKVEIFACIQVFKKRNQLFLIVDLQYKSCTVASLCATTGPKTFVRWGYILSADRMKAGQGNRAVLHHPIFFWTYTILTAGDLSMGLNRRGEALSSSQCILSGFLTKFLAFQLILGNSKICSVSRG